MTSIDAAVRTALLACTGVTTLVSTRVYADLPPNVTLPAISVEIVSDIPDEQVPDLWTARVTVNCWSDPPDYNGVQSPEQVIQIADAVYACLHRAKLEKSIDRWTVGSTVYAVSQRTVENSRRMDDTPTGWFRAPVDVLLTFRKVT